MEPFPLSIGAACSCVVWLVWVRWWERRGSYRKGEEHGSARWATANEMASFSDKRNPDNNIILTKNARLALDRGRFDLKTDRNHNVVVVGGSGSGKTRYYVKPNLMQLNSSYFVTDPKGTSSARRGISSRRRDTRSAPSTPSTSPNQTATTRFAT